ncbi:uncharacterized protein B0I36DRAFT_345999 [Microdochium trichocladiopsis]|uniref:Uncharacterized protein n=1 Tax=Microdochium trichocladiopsis TaxID=1682393 RepID=A0A9P9BUT1_9PEZI|nr:uncharacterized protein B0I36DRAFT_345999 [Microdochium trichocladiopsis]KAH7037961.1 hypothetical protein B0I36DRAFT_345999 [Microdochium trichocladiopsis]
MCCRPGLLEVSHGGLILKRMGHLNESLGDVHRREKTHHPCDQPGSDSNLVHNHSASRSSILGRRHGRVHEGHEKERKGKERKSKESKGKERKGKGKEGKGKGKESKGKDSKRSRLADKTMNL